MSDRHRNIIQNEHAEQTRKNNEDRDKSKVTNPISDLIGQIGSTVGEALEDAGEKTGVPIHRITEPEPPKVELPKLDPTTVPKITPLFDKASAVEAYHAFNFSFAGDVQKKEDKDKELVKTREERVKESLDSNIRNMWEAADQRRAGYYFFNNTPMGQMLSADAAADNLVNNGVLNKDAERNLKVIQDIFQGKYAFGVTEKEFNEWHKKAYKKTGDYLRNPDGSFQLDAFGNKIPETVLRSDAPPPPIGTDEANYDRWMKNNTYLTQEQDKDTGEWKDVRYRNPDAEDMPVRADEFKKYWDWYLMYNKNLDIEHKMAEEKSHYMAGVDPDASDSLLDVVRDAASGKQDILTGAYKYFDNYVFNPLKHGDWGTLGMNTLVNLGETMDLFGVGTRAIVGAQDNLKFDGRHVVKGQHEFVYSSGEDKQKELMEHGAGDLIRYREGMGGKYTVDVKAAEIKADLQKAGLWDEYLKLEEEWNAHDNKGDIIGNLKAAYTTHENFEGDTGNTVRNLVVETLLDPSLIVGGTAKFASSAGSKAAAKTALKTAIEGVDDLATKEFIDFINVGKGAVKTYMREVGEGIVMKNSSTIKTAIENFADRAIKDGMFVPENKDVFVGLVKEAIGDVEHNAEYRFIQSLGKVDRMVDNMDSILLKSSFIVPYAPYKTMSMVRKTLRNTEKYANWRGGRQGQRELQAMRDLFDGLVDEDNRIPIGNFGEAFRRMREDAVARADDRFRNNVINKLTKDMSDHVAIMKRVTDQLSGGNYSPDEVDELLNNYIRNVSDNKITSVDDFKDYIDNIFNEGADKFKGALDEMKRTLDDQFKYFETAKEISVDKFKNSFYEELSKARSFEELQSLANNYKRFANYVDSSFESDIVLRANEFVDQTIVSVDEMLRNFEYKNSTTVHKPSAVIDDILKSIDKDETSRYLNKLHPDSEVKVKEFADYLEDNFDRLAITDKKLLGDFFFDDAFDYSIDAIDSRSVIKNARISLKDINPRELRTKLVETIRDKELLFALGGPNNHLESDVEFLNRCKDLVKQLDDTQLNIHFSDDMELLDLHCDIFNIFNKYISDGRFADARNALETSGVLEKIDKIINALEHWNSYYDSDVSEFEISSFSRLKDTIRKLSDLRSRLYSQMEVLKAYDNLTVSLKRIPGLSDNQYWTVLDSIFGFTKNNPEDFYIKASRNPERLIEKINLNMDTLFGKSRVSLDGFRYEARNMSSELWSDYSDEIINNPELEERVQSILSDGHLDPDKDVQTQMLQVILRDKGAIDYYNSLAREQAVFFTDIETTGLSSNIHEITDIACRRWQSDVIDSSSSLEEILDFIEGCEVHRSTSKRLNEDIRKSMTTTVLESLFKDAPNAGRNEMLDEYCSLYGTEDAAQVISESDMLKGFVTELDRAFDEFDGKTPVLVTHSNRGFDQKFIRDRIVLYKQDNIDVTPSHIVHLQDLLDASESTVERLKGLTDDIILTSTQASMIEDAVIDYARRIGNYSESMKIFNLDAFDDFFKLEEHLNGINFYDLFNTGEVTGMLDPKIRQVLKELRDYYKSSEFVELKQNYDRMFKEIHSETRRFNGNMLLEGAKGKSLFKEAFDAGDSIIPEVGYDIAGSARGDRSALRYFSLDDSRKVNIDIITSATNFTKEVDNMVRYQLRQNKLVEELENEFRIVIRYAKGYAVNLSDNDPLLYFKYLKEPETPYEAFAMAQLIWDKTLKYTDYYTLETAAEAYKSFGGIQDSIKDYVLSFIMSGKNFNLWDAVSEDALSILKGESCQEIIFKHGIPELYHPKVTKPLESVKDFLAMQAKCDQNLRAHTAYTNTVEGFVDEAEDYAIKTAHETMVEIGEDIRRMEEEARIYAEREGLKREHVIPTFIEIIKRQFNERRKIMTSQILEYVSQSEDNLIGHLLFHNHQLHIPIKGDYLHTSQIEAFRKMLTELGDDSPIVYKERNGYIHIGIKRDTNIRITNDSRYADEKATQMIDGRNVVYSAPEYKSVNNNVPDDILFERWIDDYIRHIAPTSNAYVKYREELMPYLGTYLEIMNKMQKVSDQIDFLTEGKSVGSVGTLHTLNRQKQIYRNLPKDFLDEILTEETSCDARFWHQASFDMTCLGDSENMWKYTDYNDADPLLSLYNTLEEVTGSASAQRMYLGYWNHPDSPYKLSSMFEGLDDAEKIRILNDMDDMAIVNFNAVDTAFFGGLKSKTGVEVSELQINDLTDLRRAEASGAIVVPYEMYLDMQEVLNKSEITDTIPGKVMKAWSKCIWLYKVGQLSNPGTWTRNWIDATMKMTGETGSAGETARFQLKAMHTLMTYKTISRKIKKISDLNYTTATDIEREYKKLPERFRNQMSYEEYKFIDDWMKVSIAGGESRTMKSIADYSNSAVNLNAALKQGSTEGILTQKRLDELKQGYDLIGDEIKRFEELGEQEVKSLIYESNTWLWNDLSKARFMEIFRKGQDIATDEELFEYNRICNELIADRFKRIRGDRKISNIINHTASFLLTPMSLVEENIRLAQYMALEEQGFTRNQIFKSITSSQFNYDNKSMRAKMIEMFIPYYGFMDANLSYWCKSLDKNPRMLRYVEHIWGELSWDAAMQYGEDPEENMSVNYMMGHGGIPVGDSGMYLKTEPSFLQPINLLLGSPSEYVNTLATPFQFGIKSILGSGGGEYSSLFHEISNGPIDVKNEFFNSLPFIGSAKTRYYDHFTAEQPRWERLQDANFIERNLVKFNPSLFGAIKRYQTDRDDAYMSFQHSLAAQGKWWDQNLQRVVPISMKNYDGLNNPNLTFDERAELVFLYQNKLWDSNKNQFVDVDNYEAGGLNREFNFDNPGEWDEFCKLKEKKLNQKWDYNKRKWVDASKYEEIMLNDPNCSWEDNQRYHEELFGEKYDYNQGKYVQKKQFIKGGLNDEYGSHTFAELCALQYALHGKEYVRGEGFVQTREPIVQYDVPETNIDETVKYDRTDPVQKMLARLGLVEETYADTLPELVTTQKGIKGRWVLNGNPRHDAAVFDDIISEFSDKAPTFDNSTRFNNWTGTTWRRYNSGWRDFADLPELPKAVRYAMKPQKKVKFGYSYTSGAEYAALRTALYGTQVYEDYYKFEFSYNYNYRSPSAGPKKYAGSLYRAGQYHLRGGQNRIKDKWRYYAR